MTKAHRVGGGRGSRLSNVASNVGAMRQQLRRVALTLRAILGVPDYERYVAHVRTRHPGREPLSREVFAREQMERRYDRPGSRCC